MRSLNPRANLLLYGRSEVDICSSFIAGPGAELLGLDALKPVCDFGGFLSAGSGSGSPPEADPLTLG